jgi:hypothetical protein
LKIMIMCAILYNKTSHPCERQIIDILGKREGRTNT